MYKYDRAAVFARLSIGFCDTATLEEKNRHVLGSNADLLKVEGILASIRATSHGFLCLLTGEGSSSAASPYSTALRWRVGAGGEKCDACGKSREELQHRSCGRS